MFRPVFLSVLGLGAAVALPAIFYNASAYWKGDAKPKTSAATVQAAGPTPTAAAGAAPAQAPPLPGSLAPPPLALEGTPVRDMAEVLRFDITPDWIMNRWPRVSTGLDHLELQGYRVPLVTGTAEHDLAGALTYYFNPRQQVQRIAFRGTTGDTRRLASTVISRYHLTRRLTNDPGLLVYEAVRPNDRPASALRFRAAPVISAGEPYRRFDVEMVLERPEE